MTTLLVIIWGILAVLLMFVSSFQPERSPHSWFELKRLDNQGVMRRERLFGIVIAIKHFLSGLLIIVMTAIALLLWQGWVLVVMPTALILAMMLGGWRPLQRRAAKAYASYESRLLDFVERAPLVGRVLGSGKYVPRDLRLESSEHLLHLVESAGNVLTDDQQKIIRHGLNWHETAVKSVMTPRNDIVSVKHRELLGPLVLDGLHRSGHTRFPVVRGDIDNVIGTLDITELLEVDAAKKTKTAEQAMSSQALRIESDEPLPAALALLQKSHHHLLIVVDEEGRTAGLVTLADITGSLLGNNTLK